MVQQLSSSHSVVLRGQGAIGDILKKSPLIILNLLTGFQVKVHLKEIMGEKEEGMTRQLTQVLHVIQWKVNPFLDPRRADLSALLKRSSNNKQTRNPCTCTDHF